MRAKGFYGVADLALELAPAALFNFAVAFAVATIFRQNGLADLAAAASVASGIAAFLAAWYLLRRTGRAAARFPLPRFEGCGIIAEPVSSIAPEPDVALTQGVEADHAGQQPAAGELLLDDVIERIGPESRVIRLFDPQRMPTAGELRERIDRHLLAGSVRSSPPDATQALHEAIEELRRSLR